MKCACHGKEHRESSLTLLCPWERYWDIDPLPEKPGRAIHVCKAWLKERELLLEAQEKRRAPAGGRA